MVDHQGEPIHIVSSIATDEEMKRFEESWALMTQSRAAERQYFASYPGFYADPSAQWEEYDSDTDGEDVPVCAVEWTPGETKEGGDDANDHTGHEHGEFTEVEFESERIGRDINESIPRYDISTLRPFEVMFIDNKDYDCPQEEDTPPL